MLSPGATAVVADLLDGQSPRQAAWQSGVAVLDAVEVLAGLFEQGACRVAARVGDAAAVEPGALPPPPPPPPPPQPPPAPASAPGGSGLPARRPARSSSPPRPPPSLPAPTPPEDLHPLPQREPQPVPRRPERPAAGPTPGPGRRDLTARHDEGILVRLIEGLRRD